jgi:hypothetical protein
MESLTCSACHACLKVPDELVGRWVICPRCGQQFAALREKLAVEEDEPSRSAKPREADGEQEALSLDPGDQALMQIINLLEDWRAAATALPADSRNKTTLLKFINSLRDDFQNFSEDVWDRDGRGRFLELFAACEPHGGRELLTLFMELISREDRSLRT